jgi:hypothetical protein
MARADIPYGLLRPHLQSPISAPSPAQVAIFVPGLKS